MNRRTSIFLIMLSAILVILCPVVVFADNETVSETAAAGDENLLFQEVPTVTGASKYEQTVIEAPSSVSIITAADIRRFGYRTLADVLRSLPGFFVTYDRNYSYVGVRGFGRPSDYNTRILLLIDGHRTNDVIFNQAMVGSEGILNVDLIDRFEIIRGPGSSLYGSNAFFAVVNIITRRGRDLKGGEASAESGSLDAYGGRLSYGNRYPGGTEVIASGSAFRSRGGRLYYPEYDAPATNNGITDHRDYDRSQHLFSTFSAGDFTLQGAYVSRTKGIPTGAYGTNFDDPRNRTTDIRSYGDLKYQHELGVSTDLTVRIYYDFYRYAGDYAYAGILNKDLSTASWVGSEIRTASRIREKQRLIVGAEYQAALRENQLNYDAGAWPPLLDDRRRSRVLAAYVQDEIAFSGVFTMEAGVRHDHYDTFGGTTNPRVALIIRPAPRSVIKALYGTAFRAPNAFELYYHSPGLSAANPELLPEKIVTTEVVFEQIISGNLRATISGYSYRVKDLINYGVDTVSGLPQFQNLDQVTARGGELGLEGKWRNGLDARASCAVQRTKDLGTGEPLTNSPAFMAKLNVAAPFAGDRLLVGIEEQYLGRRRTERGAFAPAFGITNLSVTAHTENRRLEATASIYNLFDRAYGDPVSLDFRQDTIEQDGRNFRVKISYAF